jgi:hypothetical protein
MFGHFRARTGHSDPDWRRLAARWNPDGTELFYIAADDYLMAVPMRFSPDGATVDPGTPTRLFVTTAAAAAFNANRHQYAVASNGRVFRGSW